MKTHLEELRDELARAHAEIRDLRARLGAAEQERNSLAEYVRLHGQECVVCGLTAGRARLATRSYADPDGGALVWICDAPECAELWRCERCGATDFAMSHCPLCGHPGVVRAALEFTESEFALGLRYANLAPWGTAPEAA